MTQIFSVELPTKERIIWYAPSVELSTEDGYYLFSSNKCLEIVNAIPVLKQFAQENRILCKNKTPFQIFELMKGYHVSWKYENNKIKMLYA